MKSGVYPSVSKKSNIIRVHEKENGGCSSGGGGGILCMLMIDRQAGR